MRGAIDMITTAAAPKRRRLQREIFISSLSASVVLSLLSHHLASARITADTAKRQRRHGNIGGWREHFSSIFHQSARRALLHAQTA